MLVLPFATLLFNYLYARQLLRQENLSYQNAVLVQAQMMVDEKLQSLQQFALDMQNDQTISDFLMRDDLSGSELQMEIWHLSRYLGGYAATYRDLCECFVYSINYDYLISARSADSGSARRSSVWTVGNSTANCSNCCWNPGSSAAMPYCATVQAARWSCCTRFRFGVPAARKTAPSAC